MADIEFVIKNDKGLPSKVEIDAYDNKDDKDDKTNVFGKDVVGSDGASGTVEAEVTPSTYVEVTVDGPKKNKILKDCDLEQFTAGGEHVDRIEVILTTDDKVKLRLQDKDEKPLAKSVACNRKS